jgi:hypothetical protein
MAKHELCLIDGRISHVPASDAGFSYSPRVALANPSDNGFAVYSRLCQGAE